MKVSDLKLGGGIRFKNNEYEFIVNPIGCIKYFDSEDLKGPISVYSVDMKTVINCFQDKDSGELINIYPLKNDSK